MIDAPRIKANLQVAVVDDDKVFLSDEDTTFLIEGRAPAAVASLLDGARQLDEVLVDVPAEFGVGTTMAAVRWFMRTGHVSAGPPGDDPAVTSWWDRPGVTPAAAAEAVGAARIAVTTVGDVDPAPLVTALRGNGLHVVETGPGGHRPHGGQRVDIDPPLPAARASGAASPASRGLDHPADATGLTVVLVADYLDGPIEGINRRMLDEERDWLLCRLAGERVHLGPHFRPGRSACWRCLAQRLSGNRQLDDYLERKKASTWLRPAIPPALPSTIAAAAGLVATEVTTIVVMGTSPRLAEGLVTFDPFTFQASTHHVVRRPQCPACGETTVVDHDPTVALHPAPKAFTADGGHRTERPEVTYERLIKHLSPLTGAVSTLSRQHVEDNGVAYSYASGHNFALMQDSTYFLRKNLRGRSGGKGRTDVQAKVGAICEAIERYAGVFRGDERRLRRAFSELGGNAVHPGSLLLFSERQYAERDAWNMANGSSYHLVPEIFDEDRPVDWTAAWSLRDQEPRLVPTGYCYFGHPDIAEHFFCASDANGNAAGNTIEEAILQGLLELVERDSVALWWYQRAQRPAVDLDALGESFVDAVRQHHDRLGRSLWMLDLTSDLGIAAFAGVSRRHDGPTEDILIGFGAHVDPRMAAMRALTEVNQFLPAVTDVRDDGTTRYWMDDPDAIRWWTTSTVATDPYLLPDHTVRAVDPWTYRGLSTDDLAIDVRNCVERIAAAGHDVVVLDQTRPDIELNVVKVMAPGLRHFWRRLGPGRLYDVPVKLGWPGADVDEHGLNPKSIFF